MKLLYILTPLAPLFGAIAAGFFGQKLGRVNSHRITIAGVAIAFLLSLIALFNSFSGGEVFNETIYTWMVSGGIKFEVGFLVDRLTMTRATSDSSATSRFSPLRC